MTQLDRPISTRLYAGTLAILLPLLVGWLSFKTGAAKPSVSEAARADVVMAEPATGSTGWPSWRGPSRQGLVSPGDYTDTWSDTDNVLWRVEVSGEGNSSPIVWGDRIFLTTSYDHGQRRSILGFDRRTGERLWETVAPDSRPEAAYPKNGHASSTPATDGERIFAYLGSHGLLAVDLDGETLWHRSFGAIRTRHGTAGSPLIYKDRVILYQDHVGESGAFIAAFDRLTGEQLWWTPREEQLGWGSPVAIRVGDHDEIVVSSQARVTAYDPDTGELLWLVRGNLSEVTPTPVVGHGLVFCSSGRAGPTLAIRPGGSGDVTDSHIVWQTAKGSPFIPSPVLDGDFLYMVNDMASVATCFEARTGRLMWQGRMGTAQRESFSASPVAVDGKIFFTNDEGETFVLAAGPEFEILHVNRLGERTFASPALVDGRWYFRTEHHLLCIGRQETTAG